MAAPTVFVLTHESDPDRREKATSFIALALTRSLGRRGVPVVRVHPNLLDRSLRSRYCTDVEICPDFYESEEQLVRFLLEMSTRYPAPRVLMPASDDSAYFVARYREQLKTAYSVLGPDWTVMERLIDKKRQYGLAAELGVPIPETHFPRSQEDVEKVAAELQHYPYVIKPLVAHQWRRSTMRSISKGKKGFRVDDAAELVDRYREIAAGDARIMVQEVIGGRDDRLFTFLAYVDASATVRAYCIRKKIRQSPIDFGYCTLTVSCEDPVVERQSIRLLQGAGFHGICGVEWKLDPRTGQYKLIEINARPVNTTAISSACGVDLPYLAIVDTANLEPAATPRWRSGVKWIDVPADIWAARELMRAGQLTLRGWWSSIRGERVHAVYAPDDLRPFLGYLSAFLQSLVRGVRNRLRVR